MYKEIFAFCVRRSGHSAMLNWIAGQSEPAIWYSDIYTIENKYIVSCVIEHKRGRPVVISKPRPKPKLPIKSHPNYKMRIYSFEDCTQNPFTLDWILATIENWRTVENPYVIFTLRNMNDTYESQKHFGDNEIPEKERQRSIDIMNRQIEWTDNKDIPYILLCTEYEEWCESEAYRRWLAHLLDLPFSDRRRKEILSNSSYARGDKGEKILETRWK